MHVLLVLAYMCAYVSFAPLLMPFDLRVLSCVGAYRYLLLCGLMTTCLSRPFKPAHPRAWLTHIHTHTHTHTHTHVDFEMCLVSHVGDFFSLLTCVHVLYVSLVLSFCWFVCVLVLAYMRLDTTGGIQIMHLYACMLVLAYIHAFACL